MRIEGPEAPQTGKIIQGLDEACNQSGVEGVFCAGVALNDREQLITSGGRVMTVTGKAQHMNKPAPMPTEAQIS